MRKLTLHTEQIIQDKFSFVMRETTGGEGGGTKLSKVKDSGGEKRRCTFSPSKNKRQAENGAFSDIKENRQTEY